MKLIIKNYKNVTLLTCILLFSTLLIAIDSQAATSPIKTVKKNGFSFQFYKNKVVVKAKTRKASKRASQKNKYNGAGASLSLYNPKTYASYGGYYNWNTRKKEIVFPDTGNIKQFTTVTYMYGRDQKYKITLNLNW